MIEALKLLAFVGILEGFSSGLGGLLSGIVSTNSKKIIASLYQISAGMMSAIVCFDMLQESFNISSLFFTILFTIIGVILILYLDIYIEKNNSEKNKKNNIKGKKFKTSSLIIMFAMAAHNITEGLAIGAGSSYSFKLGLSILISIFLHNIPEGMVVGISMKLEKRSLLENIKYCILVGMPTGVGAFIGKLLGDVSKNFIAASLSLSAGAMLYIVSCDLIPNSQKVDDDKKIGITYILGMILGILSTQIC